MLRQRSAQLLPPILIALFIHFSEATTSPSVAPGLAQSKDVAGLPEHLSYFYSPADFLQMCAQFPSLSACQDPSSSLVEKRKSAYMRFGRAAPEAMELVEEEEEGAPAMEKRKSAYMRFGKRSAVEEEPSQGMEKRKSAYMRFGKRKSAYMRFGKRSADDQIAEIEKRKSAYMRFGKRSAAVEEENMGEMEKRKSAYMRFGKRR